MVGIYNRQTLFLPARSTGVLQRLVQPLDLVASDRSRGCSLKVPGLANLGMLAQSVQHADLLAYPLHDGRLARRGVIDEHIPFLQ